MPRTRLVAGRRTIVASIAAAVATGVLAGIVVAAIPGSDGLIHACYKKSGALRVVDSESGGKCTSKETALSWSSSVTAEPVPPALASLNVDGTLNAAASRGISSIKVVEYEVPTQQPPQTYAVCFDVSVSPVWGTTSGGGYVDVRSSSIGTEAEEIEHRCGPGYNALGPGFGNGAGAQSKATIRYIFWH